MTVAFLALTSLASLSVLVSAMTTDVEVSERNLALRAATSRMEEIQSFDFDQEIPAFITYLQDSTTNRFVIDGLRPVADLDAVVTKEISNLGAAYQALTPEGVDPSEPKPPSGAVIFDASNLKSISVIVVVAWVGAADGEEHTLRLSTVFSGMKS